MKLSTIITITLLVVAASIEWGIDQKSVNHIIAEEYIGECNAIQFQGAEAFQSTEKTAIVFDCEGFQGPIEGLIIISNNKIEKLEILKSYEGLDKSALDDPVFLSSFKHKTLELPLNVDAISGATITSQLIIDEMNQHIKEWNKRND